MILLPGFYEWFFGALKDVFNILHVGVISLTWVLIFKQRALGRTYPANCPSSFNVRLGFKVYIYNLEGHSYRGTPLIATTPALSGSILLFRAPFFLCLYSEGNRYQL